MWIEFTQLVEMKVVLRNKFLRIQGLEIPLQLVKILLDAISMDQNLIIQIIVK
ncbi:unnamed protein product [Paramecium octaurelia]|uniref:Uncharacterized protein n=1 Tax=Paramecium octaurelia TaxID=43137 RepID=A0A8S1YJA9_PAROT|nr:unnamed protein product [Paramecium octaurelia]